MPFTDGTGQAHMNIIFQSSEDDADDMVRPHRLSGLGQKTTVDLFQKSTVSAQAKRDATARQYPSSFNCSVLDRSVRPLPSKECLFAGLHCLRF